MTARTVRGASLIPIAMASALLLAGCDSSSDDTPTTSTTAAVMSPSMSMPMHTGTAAMPAVTKEQAEQTAVATVPGGTVVSSELNQRDGKSVWHVHIRNANGWDYDVNVDAASGAVVGDRQDGNDERTTPPSSPNAAAVTKEQAEQTAVATVPGGTVVTSELSQRDGKTVWHVHIRNANGWDYDVNVDAASGAVVPDN